jgi:asparagine synthase (glutamine-hydrolysing)
MSNKIESFTVGYDIEKVNEVKGAEQTCRHLNIVNNSLYITEQHFTDTVSNAVYYSEAPITHPNSVAVHLITNLARQKGFKVLLSGEGSDEFFGGYSRTINLFNALEKWGGYPAFLISILNQLKPNSLNALLILALKNKKYYEFAARYLRVSDEALLKKLDLSSSQSLPFIENIASQIDDKKVIESILQIEQRTYLQELLLRQDKMSMMSSIEVRVPIVEDHDLVNFANSMPAAMKIRPGFNKYILRRVAERYLPKDICYRKKIGFSSPITHWLRTGGVFLQLTRDTIESSDFNASQKKMMQQLVSDHVSGSADHNELIWKIINFVTWKKLYKV